MESVEKTTERTAQQRVDAWNHRMEVGAEVTYTKSELEGRVVLKTTGAAYLFGNEAAVELEHIGTALLTKVAPFYG